MKDLIEKLTAIETGKKQLNEGYGDEPYRQPVAPTNPDRGDDSGTLGEAGPSMLSKVYPDTKDGVLQYMQYGYDKSFLRKLDLPTCKIHADPQVEGVWAVDSMASGFRCIIYLAGYKDPWGQKRENNDNEEGGFTMSYMKKLVEHDTLNPKLMKHWVKCGSLEPKDMEKLVEYYSQNFGLDEALLSGSTQKYNEPDEDIDDTGDYNYCEKCADNFSIELDSCPNCTDLDEATNHMGETEYTTFNSWKRACRQVNPSVKFEGDMDICNAKPGVGEWDGAVGVVYNATGGHDEYWDNRFKNDEEDLRSAGMVEGDSGWDEEDEPGWMSGPEDDRDPDTAPGGHDDLATRFDDLANRREPAEGERPSISKYKRYSTTVGEGASTDQLWEVSYWVEEKSYDDSPGREYEDSVVVSAATKEEAFRKVKDRPKQVGKMRYDFKVKPAGEQGLDEGSFEKDVVGNKTYEFYFRNGKTTRINASSMKHAIERSKKYGNDVISVLRVTNIGKAIGKPVRLREGKNNMRKNKITESVEFGNASPELVKILRHFGKELKDFQEGGELADSFYDALYDYYFDDMPYGTKKARDGDPYEWISDRLDRDISGPKFGDVSDKYMASQRGLGEGPAGDMMPLESAEDNPFNDDPAPRSEDDDEYGYPGFFGQNDLNKNSNKRSLARQEEFMGLADSVGDSVELEPQPGEEIVTELQANDESKITDMLSNIGLDHGLDFWFEGNEIVVIGRNEAKLVTATVGGHIQSVDGEEYRIGAKSRAAKAAPSDIDDLTAVPELMDGMFEGKMSELDIERKEKREKASIEARKKKAAAKKEADKKAKLKEEVSVDDVEMLTLKLKSGMIGYDEFRAKLDSLEQTDYSMRQGEMGMQGDDTPAGHRHFQSDQDDYDEFGVDDEYRTSSDDDDEDFGGSLDGEFEEDVTDPTNLDQTDLDYSQWGKQGGTDFTGVDKLDMTGSQPRNRGNDPGYGVDEEVEEGQFANSAEDPAQPEVHTSTTAMINRGDDLNRPKKQSWPMRNRGDNPMAESRKLLKQYNAMKAAISLK